VKVGRVVLKDVSAQVSPVSVIGLDCLRRFTVTFDFPKRRVFLERNAQPDRPIEIPVAEMEIVEEGTAFRVNRVPPLSDAIDAGMELDDRILVIDGKETAGMDLKAVNQRLRERRASTAVVVERNGKRIDLEIRRDDKQSSE
jgi:membrane-associated protease RseP (regulator of RpoE activity)